LILQLAENPQVTATVVHFDVPESMLGSDYASPLAASSSGSKAGEVTATCGPSNDRDTAFFASLRVSLPAGLTNRVVFETVSSTSPVKDVIARASIEVGQAPRNAGDLIVLGRNISRNNVLATDDADEIRSSSSAAGTLGMLAEKVWESKLGASVLVVKAAH
jgi:hypothetical protein